MDLGLKDKVVIVTGGTKGIGLACAEKLAKHGADVVVASRTAADCEKAAADIAAKYGVKTLGVPTDVANNADIDNLFAKTVEKFGKVDVVVNNSGYGGSMRPMETMTEEEWMHMSNVNMKGVYFMCAAAKKQFMKQEKVGNIVNMASNSMYTGIGYLVGYACTKAYVGHLTKGLAIEWAGLGIRVNAVAPGSVPTEMTADMMATIKDKIIAGTPMKTLMDAEDMANAVLFLASDESHHTTGVTIAVDGGRHVA